MKIKSYLPSFLLGWSLLLSNSVFAAPSAGKLLSLSAIVAASLDPSFLVSGYSLKGSANNERELGQIEDGSNKDDVDFFYDDSDNSDLDGSNRELIFAEERTRKLVSTECDGLRVALVCTGTCPTWANYMNDVFAMWTPLRIDNAGFPHSSDLDDFDVIIVEGGGTKWSETAAWLDQGGRADLQNLAQNQGRSVFINAAPNEETQGGDITDLP